MLKKHVSYPKIVSYGVNQYFQIREDGFEVFVHTDLRLQTLVIEKGLSDTIKKE